MVREAKAQGKELNSQLSAVIAEEALVESTVARITALSENIAADLAACMPPLERAIKVIKSLRKADLDEVKAFSKPPHKVKITLEVVCIVLGKEPVIVTDPHDASIKRKDYWPVALKVLSNPKVLLDDLGDFHNKHEYDKDLWGSVKSKYLMDEEFTPASVSRASKACEGLCLWAHTLYTFFEAAEAMKPKEEALRVAKRQLAEAEEKVADDPRYREEVERKAQESGEETRSADRRKGGTLERNNDPRTTNQHVSAAHCSSCCGKRKVEYSC